MIKDLTFKAIGYIGNKDAFTKLLNGGATVTEFSMCCNNGTKDKPNSIWIKCQIWGEYGKKIAQYLTAKSHVLCEGEFDRIEIYTTQQGEQKSNLVMNVKDVRLFSKQDQSSAKSDFFPAQTYTPAAPYNQPDTDDLPF